MRFSATALPPERFKAEARRFYQQAVASAEPPDLRNVDAVDRLDKPLQFTFRGRAYRAQPTPHADGVVFTRWSARVEALSGRTDEEAFTEFAQLLADAAARFWRLARPVRWRDRLAYRWRNPFAQATEAEVAHLVGFFAACRMIARIRYAARN